MTLTRTQLAASAAYGTSLWAVGAAFVSLNRFDAGLFAPNANGSHTTLLFAASVPITAISVVGLRVILDATAPPKKSDNKSSSSALVVATAFATAIAIIFDGAAMTYAPWLYGGKLDSGAAGAWILWGGGWGILASMVIDY